MHEVTITTTIKGEDRVFFGKRKEDKATIYISKPNWECDWHWVFGYLGNEDEHCCLSDYQSKEHYLKLKNGKFKLLTEKRNISLRDALLEDYELNPNIEDNLWEFCELVKTAYTLKETSEVLGRGGSNMNTNPLTEVIKNQEEVKRINTIVLPAIFDKIQQILEEG